MRRLLPFALERGRDRTGPYASETGDRFGRFLVHLSSGELVLILFSAEGGWEHASVTVRRREDGASAPRCPTWTEMCEVKDLFWSAAETVVQYHPAAEDYVSDHPYCLHLWRPIRDELPTPPPEMVGRRRRPLVLTLEGT